MNKLLRSCVSLLAIVMSGCGLIGFDANVSGTGEIPGELQAAVGAFSEFNAAGTLQQALSSNNSNADDITSAMVTGGTLSVVNPTTPEETLQYFSSFDIAVSAPNLPTVTVATVPSSAFASKPTSVSIQGSSIELKPYIDTGSISMTPNVTFGSQPASPVPIQMSLTVHIKI